MMLKGANFHKISGGIRAGVPLMYAHWEGFVKNTAQLYLNFVLTQKLKTKELNTCFVALSKRKLINDYKNSGRSAMHNRLVKELTEDEFLEKTVSFAISVNTKSNLNSTVFTDIANSIGINTLDFETRFNFIDESLLRRRNEIAHGNYLDIDRDSFIEIVDGVVHLLRLFKTQVENSASLEKYKKSS